MRKILMKQIPLFFMIIFLFSSTANAFQPDMNTDCYLSKNNFSARENEIFENPVQAQLYEICPIEMGASVNELSKKYCLLKSDRQTDNDNIMAYDVVFNSLNIDEINFNETVRLEFYKGNLENVRFKFDMNGEVLKNILINKWGTPVSSITINDKTRYTWKNGDYEARLLTDGNEGSLVFYYMPYAENANEIKRLAYAKHLKTAPGEVNRLENLIKNSPQFKESFGRELQNDPEYARALQEAGMDMSIFD